MLVTAARRGLKRPRVVVRPWQPSQQGISTRKTLSDDTKYRHRRRRTSDGVALAVALGAVVAGSGALWWTEDPRRLLENANLMSAFDTQHGREEDNDGVAHEPPILARDGSSDDGQEEDKDLEEMNVTRDFTQDRLNRVLVDYSIYQSSSSLIPSQEDKTGISLVSWGGYSHQPPHINVFSWLLGLPTHTLALSYIVGGGNPRFLGEVLLDAVSRAVADAVSSYDASQTFTSSPKSYSSDGEGGLSIGYLEALDQEEIKVPAFTPDTVRPQVPQHEIGRALKRAFIGTDYRMVYGIVERIAQMSKQQKTGTDTTADVVDMTKPVSSVSTAIMGLYESDTKQLTLALVGDSRAVLGRPVRRASTPDPIPESAAQNEALLLPTRSRNHYRTLYRPFTLTADQTPSNSEEVARVQATHQGQRLFLDSPSAASTVPTSKSYLGLPVTRGFGCGALKWTVDFQRTLQDEFLGDDLPTFFLDGTVPGPPGVSPPDLPPQGPHPVSSPDFPQLCRAPTPPANAGHQLLTAEPEITSVRIQPGDFIVLGSKGLFECLNSEEVVGLVGVWAEERGREKEQGGGRGPSSVRAHKEKTFLADDPVVELMPLMQKADTLPYDDQIQVMKKVNEHGSPRQRRLVDRSELPIISDSSSDDPELVQLSRKNDRLNSARKAFRYSKSWKMPEKAFVFSERDRENVAAHVLRNALGGEREDFVRALSLMNREQVSNFVEDIGLTVIFFD